jgi:hypothetical protein
VCVTIAANGTKLPPFFVFKGVPGAILERGLVANNVKGCCQKNGWFDESVVKKYVNAILQPYVQNTANAVLLCDHYKVHLMASFVDACNDIGIDVEYIPPGYTCVLQPVDVGFNATLKHFVRKEHHKWCITKYKNVDNRERLPTPTKENIMDWVHFAYDNIKEESIVNTFRRIGYNCTDFDDSEEDDSEEEERDNSEIETEEEGMVEMEHLEVEALEIDADDIRLPDIADVIRRAVEDTITDTFPAIAQPDESQFY